MHIHCTNDKTKHTKTIPKRKETKIYNQNPEIRSRKLTMPKFTSRQSSKASTAKQIVIGGAQYWNSIGDEEWDMLKNNEDFSLHRSDPYLIKMVDDGLLSGRTVEDIPPEFASSGCYDIYNEGERYTEALYLNKRALMYYKAMRMNEELLRHYTPPEGCVMPLLMVREGDKRLTVAQLFIKQFLNNGCDGFGLRSVKTMYKLLCKNRDVVIKTNMIGPDLSNNAGYPLFSNYQFTHLKKHKKAREELYYDYVNSNHV